MGGNQRLVSEGMDGGSSAEWVVVEAGAEIFLGGLLQACSLTLGISVLLPMMVSPFLVDDQDVGPLGGLPGV